MNRTTQLREAFKLALSMLLFYWLTLWMDWDYSKFGALAIVESRPDPEVKTPETVVPLVRVLEVRLADVEPNLLAFP